MSYTDKQVAKKLKILNKNIKGSEEEIIATQKLLKEMSEDSVGRDVVMNMPTNVAFVRIPAEEAKRRGFGGQYTDEDKTITLPGFEPGHPPEGDEKTKQMITLAHEMTHAKQAAQGLFNLSNVSKGLDAHTAEKLSEMETKLQDTRYNAAKFADRPEMLTEEAKFFLAEKARYDKSRPDFPEEWKEQSARNSVVRLFWTNGQDMPKQFTPVSKELEETVTDWNSWYNKQSLNNRNFGEVKEQRKGFWKKLFEKKGKSQEEIITTFEKNMGTALPHDILSKKFAENSEVKGNDSVVQKRKNGSLISKVEKIENNRTQTSSYDKNGNLKDVSVHSPNGYTERSDYYFDNRLAISCEYENGSVKQRKNFDKDGNYSIEPYVKGNNNFPLENNRYYTKDGKEFSGVFVKTFANCTISQECQNGVPNGKEIIKDKDGNLERVSQRINGKREGVNLCYHKDGYIEETCHYKAGILRGDLYGFNSDGTVQYMNYRNEKGKIHGMAFKTEKDGVLMKAKFDNGNRIGDFEPASQEEIARLNMQGQKALADIRTEIAANEEKKEKGSLKETLVAVQLPASDQRGQENASKEPSALTKTLSEIQQPEVPTPTAAEKETNKSNVSIGTIINNRRQM